MRLLFSDWLLIGTVFGISLPLPLELLTEGDAAEGHEEDLRIEQKRAVAEIVKVVFESPDHLLDGVGVAVEESGIGGDAGADLEKVVVARVHFDDLLDEVLPLGAGADEGHVTLEDIEQLRQLVEMMLPDEFPDLREPRIILTGEERRTVFFGIGTHRPELVDPERPSEPSDSLLTVDGRTAVFDLDGKIDYQEERGKNDQADGRDDKVDTSLEDPAELAHAVGDEFGLAGQFPHRLLLHVAELHVLDLRGHQDVDPELEPELAQVVILDRILVLVGVEYAFDALLLLEDRKLGFVLVGEDSPTVDDLAISCRIVREEADDVVVRRLVETVHHRDGLHACAVDNHAEPFDAFLDTHRVRLENLDHHDPHDDEDEDRKEGIKHQGQNVEPDVAAAHEIEQDACPHEQLLDESRLDEGRSVIEIEVPDDDLVSLGQVESDDGTEYREHQPDQGEPLESEERFGHPPHQQDRNEGGYP